MTLAHRVETVLTENGKLALTDLPFRAGQAVEVIVLPAASPAAANHPLRGMVQRYEDPFAPVAEEDWGAAR